MPDPVFGGVFRHSPQFSCEMHRKFMCGRLTSKRIPSTLVKLFESEDMMASAPLEEEALQVFGTLEAEPFEACGPADVSSFR